LHNVSEERARLEQEAKRLHREVRGTRYVLDNAIGVEADAGVR
jgi:hypothetical protein